MEEAKEKKLNLILIKFFLPILIAVSIIIFLYISVDKNISGKLILLLFAYFFPPLGKESIIPIGVGGGEFTVHN